MRAVFDGRIVDVAAAGPALFVVLFAVLFDELTRSSGRMISIACDDL